MKTILINPFDKTVTALDIEVAPGQSSYNGLRHAIHPDDKGYIEHVTVAPHISMYVDEEGLLKPWQEQAFFSFSGRNFAGRALITGSAMTDEGMDAASVPAGITPERIQSLIEWVEPKDVSVPAPVFYSDAELEPGNPLRPRKGAVGTVLVGNKRTWDFENQPPSRADNSADRLRIGENDYDGV